MCFSHPLIVHWGEIICERILFIVFTNFHEIFSRDVYDIATTTILWYFENYLENKNAI